MVFVVAWLATLTLLTVAALWAIPRRRIDVIDALWGVAVATALLAATIAGDGWSSAGVIMMTLVSVWAVRLSWHVGRRFLRSGALDPRYAQLAKRWRGPFWLNAYGRVYVVQSFLAVVVAGAAISTALWSSDDLLRWVYAGAGMALVGFVFESIADRQLRNHLSAHRGKRVLMTSGLWRYSRHPNYFGEALFWWGVWVTTLSTPYWLPTLIAPLTITVLLRFVSGVPPAERRMADMHGWPEYRRQANVFVPWWPKRK